jgi:hypothetical protein
MIKKPWTCPEEASWTRFLLDADFPGREELSRHLATCEYCRASVAAKKQELDQLAASWKASGRPNVFYLSLLPESTGGQPDAGLLAAKGEGETQLPEAATLGSPQQEILLRIVRDQYKGEVWLYLMAEDLAQFGKVVLKPFGEDQEYVTDEEGRINLGVRDWPKPEQMTAEVYLPMATFILQPIEEHDREIHSVTLESPGGDRIKVSYKGDRRNRVLEVQLLEVSDIHEDVPLKVGVRGLDTPGLLHVQSIVSQKASFKSVESKHGVEIYLYQ